MAFARRPCLEKTAKLSILFGQGQTVGAQVLVESAEDAALVGAAREGDRAAFGQLYERYARVVHGVLLSRVPPNDVEDLVQDVFLNAWRRLRTLRDDRAFGAWLAAIARNRAAEVAFRPPSGDAVRAWRFLERLCHFLWTLGGPRYVVAISPFPLSCVSWE